MSGKSGTDAQFPSEVRQNVVNGECFPLIREQEALQSSASPNLRLLQRPLSAEDEAEDRPRDPLTRNRLNSFLTFLRAFCFVHCP